MDNGEEVPKSKRVYAITETREGDKPKSSHIIYAVMRTGKGMGGGNPGSENSIDWVLKADRNGKRQALVSLSIKWKTALLTTTTSSHTLPITWASRSAISHTHKLGSEISSVENSAKHESG
jgi:hypothetical protein